MNSPILMSPAFRHGADTPWGGAGLRGLGKNIPDERTGESLEVSVLGGLESRSPDGKTLTEILSEGGAAVRGTAVGEEFPLLLKLISADDWLSVQVHPDDSYAKVNENGKLGKTEAWVILDAKPDSKIVYGIAEGVSESDLENACKTGGEAVKACLNTIPVKAGEVYFIPAGMVHALGSGITLMEIQQSSDVTYRFYDWDRVNALGQGRPLHIKKGLDVIKPELRLTACKGEKIGISGGEIERYIDNKAFVLEKWSVLGEAALPDSTEHFKLMTALGGLDIVWSGGELSLKRGDCVFLPADLTGASLRGKGEALLTWTNGK